jgi:hypothetical protein
MPAPELVAHSTRISDKRRFFESKRQKMLFFILFSDFIADTSIHPQAAVQ